MSREHPFILYVGDVETGRALSVAAEAWGWYVLLPHDDLEALAMYSVYHPDVSVIDQTMDFADEVEFHLRSIEAELILTREEELYRAENAHELLGVIDAHLNDSRAVRERNLYG